MLLKAPPSAKILAKVTQTHLENCFKADVYLALIGDKKVEK
jgi:hypothetical protein